VLFWIVAMIVGGLIGRAGWMGMPGGWFGGPVVKREAEVDPTSALGALAQWGREVEAAGKRVEQSAKTGGGVPDAPAIGQLMGAMVGADGSSKALSAAEIKALLPETLGGLPRVDLSAERNAALGFEIAEARARYSDGAGRNLNLSLNDTGGAKGLLALASWAGVEQEREWNGGYQRDYRVDGRMVHERWDTANGQGEYGVVVGKRFLVEIEGHAAGIDELKTALGAGIDLARLEAIAASTKQ
jgi:hypothetical protein